MIKNSNTDIKHIAIAGNIGAGKTTLMNIIGCLDTPTSGQYFLNDKPVGDMTENQLAKIRNQNPKLSSNAHNGSHH